MKISTWENENHSIASIMSRVGMSENREWYASKLDGVGPHASRLQNERFDLAVSYLETHCRTTTDMGQEAVDREKVLRQLDSIDFHKPVTLETLKPGREVVEHTFHHKTEHCEHFTRSGMPTQRMGMIQREETRRCTVKQEMVVLQSHTRGTVDTWSDNRQVRTPAKHTKAGTTILNNDPDKNRAIGSQGLKSTNDSRQARSIFRQSEPTKDSLENKKTLKHNSGEYVAGGGVQYHIPKREDKPEVSRHRNLTPVKSQKRGSITR